MALTLRWVQTWDGSDLTWSQTWGDSGVFVLNAQAPIALVGQMGVAGDIAIETPTTFQLQAQAPIALAGVLGISGDLTIRSPWELLAPLQLGAMVGVLGISGDLVFSSPSTFQLQPVAPIALLGSLDIAGDIEIATAVVFELSALAPIALAGSLGIQGDLVFERTFSLAAVAPIAMTGALAIAGDVQFERTFALEPVAAIALSGQLGISGDLVIAQAVLFELQAQAPVALVGLLGIQAEIESTVPFDLVAGAPIALQGVLGIAAAPVFGSPFELVVEQPLALTGTLGVSGDIELVIPATVPDVVGLTQAAAILALEAAGFVVVVVTATSDTIAAGQVISQAPSAGTESTVGSIVTITVSSGQGAATDPRLIGGRRRKYPNIKVKGPRRRKDDDEPDAVVAPATPSGLLLGLLARGLTAPVPPAGTPEPAPALADASITEGLLAEPPVPPEPSDPEEKPEAEAAEVESPSAIALLEELRADVKALRAEIAQMRQGAAAPDLPPLRDPIADALQAIIPALREPVDLTDPPPAAPRAPTMTKDEIDRENERRIAAAVKRLL